MPKLTEKQRAVIDVCVTRLRFDRPCRDCIFYDGACQYVLSLLNEIHGKENKRPSDYDYFTSHKED